MGYDLLMKNMRGYIDRWRPPRFERYREKKGLIWVPKMVGEGARQVKSAGKQGRMAGIGINRGDIGGRWDRQGDGDGGNDLGRELMRLENDDIGIGEENVEM